MTPTRCGHPQWMIAAALMAAAELLTGCDLGNKFPDSAERPASGPAPAARGQPDCTFFGVADPGRRIAYSSDGSGSMTDSIMYVKYELKRSIRALRPDQQFHLTFWGSTTAIEMAERGMLSATDANKEKACDFIDGYVPTGQTDPEASLRRAFQQMPDAIFMLTDGEVERKIVTMIDALNAERKVRAHAIGFLHNGGQALLKQIAARNGGTYKYVSEEDLEQIGR